MARQSLIFYNDMLPLVHAMCGAIWKNAPLKVADIGANSGAGAAHLAGAINNLSGYKIEMSAFEIQRIFADYARAKFPDIEYIVGDFFDDPRVFDFAVCSHTLEHIPEPSEFVEKVLKKVKLGALFYTPYNEQKLAPAHINRFDDALLQAMPGIVWAYHSRSVGWRTTDDAVCVTFVCAPPEVRENAELVDKLCRGLRAERAGGELSLAGAADY